VSVKRRVLPHRVSAGRILVENYSPNPIYNLPFGVPKQEVIVGDPRKLTILGSQETESEGHPWRRSKVSPLQDVGGNFRTIKKTMSAPHGASVAISEPPVFFQFNWEQRKTYVGPVYPFIPANMRWPSSAESSSLKLDQLGAVAVSRCKPEHPIPNLTELVGELARDGIPRLPLDRWQQVTKDNLDKEVAGEYLNAEYGWKPLISELTELASAFVDAERKLAQYERDARRVVRRRYSFPSEHTSETTQISVPNGPPVMEPEGINALRTSVRNLVRVRSIDRHCWFSGAFTYFLPPEFDSRKELTKLTSLADRILGLELTPSVLWELAPWSWAIDWFSNTSEVLSNFTDIASGSLVMRYGYLMEHTIITDTYSLVDPRPLQGMRAPVPPVSFTTEVKLRRRANPFGFGVSWSGLSAWQLSIAAALGINRSRESR
jgi:hypothetical protein